MSKTAVIAFYAYGILFVHPVIIWFILISSQHICNWLAHEILDESKVHASFKKMAAVVDKQNENEPNYSAMSNNFDHSLAFQAALDLAFKGKS